jgi:isoleucyl-tRNA synthetase
MYLEGSDQHRGWFQSSLLASVGTRGRAPYRIVLTHGFTVDKNGKKMSKSQGNVVAPQDVIKKTGAEILRLWVSAEDYRGDIKISDEIIARLTDAYRKIRNTARYLLGNLADFDRADHCASLTELDRWAMSRLQGLIAQVTESYENFRFHEVYHRIYSFCVIDMSSFYLDILKDRLYTSRADSPERRAAQWVLNEILLAMTRLMAPVMSFTAEEIWSHTAGDRAESVFLSGFPTVRAGFLDTELEQRWETIIAMRDEVLKALEIKRREKVIGNSLAASVTIYGGTDEMRAMASGQYAPMLPMLLITSQARHSGQGADAAPADAWRSEEIKSLAVDVVPADGGKCERCWMILPEVGSIPGSPDLCPRCHAAVQ